MPTPPHWPHAPAVRRRVFARARGARGCGVRAGAGCTRVRGARPPQGHAAAPAAPAPVAAAPVAARLGGLMGFLGWLSAQPAVSPGASEFYSSAALIAGAVASAVAAAAPGPPLRVSPDPCGSNITCLIARVFDDHEPFEDADGDNFAGEGVISNGLRGADWRGRDCNDSDASVYPGSNTPHADPNVDHNCACARPGGIICV